MSDLIKEIFSRNLRYYMEKAGITQADISRVLNVSSATVSDWYNGEKYPRTDKINKLADLLGVRFSVLMMENDHGTNESEIDETRIIEAYRKADDGTKAAVRKLLDLPEAKKGLESTAI